MPSGRKVLVWNTQERAISPDQNRAQAFAGRDDAELWRYLLDVTSNDDLDAGSVVAEHLTTENPLRAEIINGLLVRPQPASLNLLVDPGVAYVVAPDGDADASVYKYVRDAGVTALGALAITPGAGSTRIDVIECQISAVPLTASDNRDIFDPVTGLFTASSVTKETQLQLTYRVRAGIAGGGFPGTVLGWLPLCVASVPAGAASVDVVTFWDVRPLISDRSNQPFGSSVARPVQRSAIGSSIALATTTGLIDMVVGGRRLGGRLRSGSVVADADSIDVSIAANREPGFLLVASRPWYLYLLTPFGLPRWARYNAAGTRVPRSPRGIPVVSMTASDADGLPTAAIGLPTVTGLGGTTSSGACAYVGYTTSGSAMGGFFGDNNNGYILSGAALTGDPLEAPGAPSGGGTPNLSMSFTLTSGIGFPSHARAVLLEPRFSYAPLAGERFNPILVAQAFGPNGGPQIMERILQSDNGERTLTGGADGGEFASSFWLPLPTVYPSNAAYTIVIVYQLRNFVGNLGGVISNVAIRTLGWNF